MKTLHITVARKVARLCLRSLDFIVCGNSNYQIEFSFDSEWDAYEEKTARFIYNGQYYDVDFSGTTCPVPVLLNTKSVEVGVYITEDGLHTTTGATIQCRPSILCDSTEEGVEIPLHDGESAYIRYSANPDGTNFTEKWQTGQNYIGFANGRTAPTDKKDYAWFQFITTDGGEEYVLKPTTAFPLDARIYFTSLADAKLAANSAEAVGSSNTVYYYGMKLLVYENNTVKWYTIQTDNTLIEDGKGVGLTVSKETLIFE